MPTTTCNPSCEEGYECYGRGCVKLCNSSENCSDGKYCSYLELGRHDYVEYVNFCTDLEDIASRKLYYCEKVNNQVPCIKKLVVQEEYTQCKTNNDCTSYVHEGVCHAPIATPAPVSVQKYEEYKQFIREVNNFDNFDESTCPEYIMPKEVREYQPACYNNQCRIIMVKYEDYEVVQ